MMSVVCVIPARYPSVRFPGKPLAMLRGAGGTARSLIERTWRAAQEVDRFDAVYVATDDARIAEAARDFGADVLMTSDTCRNGTERCAEALGLLGDGVEMVVNLQGDAPLTPPWFLDALVEGLEGDSQAALATPILRCDGATLAAFKADRPRGASAAPPRSATARARSISPRRSSPSHQGLRPDEDTPVFHHVGVYAYRPWALHAYPDWTLGPLERA
jgi:3-deoxy-manno-octulosonate cytidylyltransferase (CMP-KDO synthetase)